MQMQTRVATGCAGSARQWALYGVAPARVVPQRRLTARALPGRGAERKAILDEFYNSPHDRQRLESLIADDFKMAEEGHSKTYGKQDYLGLLGAVTAAVPDFNWTHATNGEVDKDDWAIVTVMATGHHTGAPLQLPKLEPLPPSGKHFCLAEEVQRVKVTGGKVAEILVLPNKGAGPRALYRALGGTLPVNSADTATAPLP